MGILLSLFFAGLGVYLIVTAKAKGERYERAGHEPGRIRLIREEKPNRVEIRIRATLIGLFMIGLGVAAFLMR